MKSSAPFAVERRRICERLAKLECIFFKKKNVYLKAVKSSQGISSILMLRKSQAVLILLQELRKENDYLHF